MAFWVYILRCADGSYYTGQTDNLEQRVAQHQAGTIPGYTEKRRPVVLVWQQAMSTRIEALEAERRIKPWSRKKKEGLISRDWGQVSFFARPPHERASTSLGTNGCSGSSSLSPFVPSEVGAPPPSPNPSREREERSGAHPQAPPPC